MSEILELSFENINLSKLVTKLMQLKLPSELVNYQIASDDVAIDIDYNSYNQLFAFFTQLSDGSVYLNFNNFIIGIFELPKTGIQILKYSNQFDLNIEFDYESIKVISSIVYLQNWAKLMAQDLEAKTYYYGYEPASDIETRFFTEDKLGPLKSMNKDE